MRKLINILIHKEQGCVVWITTVIHRQYIYTRFYKLLHLMCATMTWAAEILWLKYSLSMTFYLSMAYNIYYFYMYTVHQGWVGTYLLSEAAEERGESIPADVSL